MKKLLLGLDVGGTKIQIGVTNHNFRILREAQLRTDRTDKQSAIVSIKNAVAQLFRPEISQIGIGIAGFVDRQKGTVTASPNFPKDWKTVNLKKIIEGSFKRPVTVDNDANCIGLAEAIIGPGRKFGRVLTLTLGTGLGSCLITNKIIYRGEIGALEFGHTVISNQPLNCSCGRMGHLEAAVSGAGISKLYFRKTGKRKDSYQIIDESRKGKKEAIKVIKSVSGYLSIGLANAIHAYNPDVIILNGGLATVREITKPAINSLPGRLLYPQMARIKVVVSQLGYRAGIIGAAMLNKFTT